MAEGVERVASPSTRHVIAGVLAAGSVIVLVGAFGTWLRSGARNRSSFALFELVDRLGFSSDGLFATAVRWWPVMPVVIVAASVALWWHRTVIAAVLALVGGGYALAMSLAVSFAPNSALISIGWGVRTSLVGSVLVFGVGSVLAGSALSAWYTGRSSARVSRPTRRG